MFCVCAISHTGVFRKSAHPTVRPWAVILGGQLYGATIDCGAYARVDRFFLTWTDPEAIYEFDKNIASFYSCIKQSICPFVEYKVHEFLLSYSRACHFIESL